MTSITDIPDEMTADEFWERFGRREHAELDFKRGVSRGMLDAIPAMAMTNGGLIIHGVDDDRTIVGCPLSQRTQDRIYSYAAKCHVTVKVKAVRVDETELTVTEVPKVDERIVTTPDGRLLCRFGSESHPLQGDALRRFVMVRTGHCAEEDALVHFDAGGFDLDLVNRALQADGRETVTEAGLTRALADLQVARQTQGRISVLWAAAVLFAKDPTEHIPGSRVQFVRRTGVGPNPGPHSARETITGPLPIVVDNCLKMITDHTWNIEDVRGLRRETVLTEYPREVLREAIINALAHRDYGLIGATVDITVWDDRIEITSPGPLPGHITVDNIRTEHCSRNIRIMGVLKIMGLVEEYGEGVDRMFRGMEARLLEPPYFNPTPSSVTVMLRNRALVGVEDQIWLQLFADHPMTVEERRALVTARTEGSVTPRRLRELMPGNDASEILAGAAAKGMLKRVGVRGGARYVLSDEVVMRTGAAGIQARSRRRQTLLDEIVRRGSISTVEGGQLLGEQTGVVRDLLNDLVRAGLARAEGQTRARRYYPAGNPPARPLERY